MTPDARPIRTVSQVAAALVVPDRRAAELLRILEMAGLAEEAQGGYRATMAAWMHYPRPPAKEAKRAA
jgi:hypothetical protein